MAIRGLASLLILVGLGLLGTVSYWYFIPPSGPAVDAETSIELLSCRAGQKCDVIVRLHNRAGRPIRVLGMVEC
jgi:uncharacterized protein (DUF58 family)